jgi:hypothetical protein
MGDSSFLQINSLGYHYNAVGQKFTRAKSSRSVIDDNFQPCLFINKRNVP